MKPLFILLLLANLVAAAWLFLGDPVDMVREPGRLALQIDPARFHIVSDEEVARQRKRSESEAAANANVSTSAPAPVDLPLAACVEIGGLSSEAAAKKMLARLASLGLGDRTSILPGERNTRLRITGIDAAMEAQIHALLKDFPKQDLAHCIGQP